MQILCVRLCSSISVGLLFAAWPWTECAKRKRMRAEWILWIIQHGFRTNKYDTMIAIGAAMAKWYDNMPSGWLHPWNSPECRQSTQKRYKSNRLRTDFIETFNESFAFNYLSFLFLRAFFAQQNGKHANKGTQQSYRKLENSRSATTLRFISSAGRGKWWENEGEKSVANKYFANGYDGQMSFWDAK